MSAPAPAAGARAGTPVGELVFAAAVAGLGIYALVRAGSINEPLTVGALGPRTLPYIVGVLLLVLGVLNVIAVLRGHLGQPEESEDLDPDAPTHWLTVGLLIGLFVVHAFLIVPLGWPIAAAVLFSGAAWIFGTTGKVRAVIYGVILALLAQFVFAGLLGVSLPAGLLAPLGVFGG